MKCQWRSFTSGKTIVFIVLYFTSVEEQENQPKELENLLKLIKPKLFDCRNVLPFRKKNLTSYNSVSGQEDRFSAFRERKTQIEKDVFRTDR
jgi:hypothetical protein